MLFFELNLALAVQYKKVQIKLTLFLSYFIISFAMLAQEGKGPYTQNTQENNQFIFYTYGFPKPFSEAREKVLQDWRIKYESIAGCIIDEHIMQKAKLQNQKTGVELTAYYGEGWEEKLAQQILEAEKKE